MRRSRTQSVAVVTLKMVFVSYKFHFCLVGLVFTVLHVESQALRMLNRYFANDLNLSLIFCLFVSETGP